MIDEARGIVAGLGAPVDQFGVVPALFHDEAQTAPRD